MAPSCRKAGIDVRTGEGPVSRSPSAPSRIAVLLAVGLTASFAARPVHAQVATAYAREAGGLFKSDLVRLLTSGGYTVEEILHIVRMNCVEFTPSERDRQDLARFRGGAEVLEEVDRCRTGSPQAAGYRNGVPVASRVDRIETPPRPDAIRVEEIELDAPASPLSGELPVLDAPETTVLGPGSGLPGVRADAPPRLLNWDDVTRRILAEYRPDVRRPGEVVLRIRVDAEGRPGEAHLERASGDPALAEAALRAVPRMRFAAAESRNRHVEAWAVLPIRFAAN
jgi:TonB family protein